MSLKDRWFRVRHRSSRKETVAFILGMEVGRMLTPAEKTALAARVRDLY
jgi:hypothetical protein